MKKFWIIIFAFLLIAGFALVWSSNNRGKIAKLNITNFEECAGSGIPIMESYPRQCRYEGKTFTENIGNELEKANLIRIASPRPNTIIKSPLNIEGEARGNWYFEASFPVQLVDADGDTIAEGHAEAIGDWMTEEFVPFKATLLFTNLKNANTGTLILKKDNASGLPEHDDALIVPVKFH